MPDITIYGLDAHDLERLQRRADANQRSLEDEIKHVLTWGVEYIERIQTIAAGMKSMEMPKPINDEAHPQALERRREVREQLRKRQEEEKRLTQELLQELDEIQVGLTEANRGTFKPTEG